MLEMRVARVKCYNCLQGIVLCMKSVPKLAPPEPPNRGGGLAQKGGPVNSQYVVLFTQRMIKVP